MKKAKLITGLDIGSSRVSALTAEIGKDDSFNIIGHVAQASKGVSRASIMDLGEATDSVSKILTRLSEKTAGRKLGDIYVNISGQSVKGVLSRGMIPLSIRGREITRMDMARCVNAAGTTHIPFDREMLHRVVHKFSIDDQSWIKNPIGLYAARLSCEVYVVSADSNHIQNIYKCVNNAGYDIKKLVFTGMADAAALLGEEEKEAGVVLVDMGASITELSFFSGGSLSDIGIISGGGEDIKGNFRDSREFADVIAKMGSRINIFKATGARINSIVLTGGIVFIDGIVEFLEEKLSLPVKVGVVKDVRGDLSGGDSMRLTTAIGLAKYAYNKRLKKLLEEKGIINRLSAKVVDIFNNYF